MQKIQLLCVLICGLLFTNIQAANNHNSNTLNKSGQFNFRCPACDGCVPEDSVTGFGTYTYPNGEVYVGNFKNGMKHGNGCLQFLDKRVYYGDFKNDKINGYGTLIYPNGDKYVGNFKDEKYNGHGTYISSNGKKVAGIFKDNILNGKNYQQAVTVSNKL
jgi:hypothetical protein